MELSLVSVLLIILLTCILCFILIPAIFRSIERIRYYQKYGEPNNGMYYDAELGSINGEVDNRGKYICDCCQKRFKTPKELKVHLRLKKIKNIKKAKKSF